jgi:hypothetical protein
MERITRLLITLLLASNVFCASLNLISANMNQNMVTLTPSGATICAGFDPPSITLNKLFDN